jgi:hypothetical protein
MPIGLLLPCIAVSAVGVYYGIKSKGHISSEPDAAQMVRRRGIFAGRRYFTEEGWKYRTWAVLLTASPVVAILVWDIIFN